MHPICSRSLRQSGRPLRAPQRLFFSALFVALSLLAASPAALSAQSSTTGAIGGTVTDANGALLPAAAVTVTSVDTGVTRTVKANASGEYTLQDLQPGTYTATFTVDGFETYREGSIVVTVGSLANVSPRLKVGSVANSVEVTDESPQLHTEDNAVSTTIDNAAIDNLPINGRRWSDFARLTPGVVSNVQGFGLLSFRGISFLLNNNTVDGADDNQAYYSEARGRTRTAFSIPPSAVQEFQVNTSNYSAQYGRAAGGVINTVTKSGSNQFHGEVFFYDRDNSLGGAVNPYTLLSVPNGNGGYNQVPTKPKDWRKDWGFTFGGPLLRDKLFFIYTYDQERRNFPAISRPTDPNDILAPSNATLPANETCSTTAFTTTGGITLSTEGDYASCELAALFGVNFQAGSAYYQQGLNIVQSFLGYVPRRQDQVINLPKVDYQINDRNRLSFLYNRMRYSSPNGLYSQSTTNEGRSGFGNDNVKEDFGITRLTSVLSNSMVNDALVQYGRDFEFDYQDKPAPNEAPLAHNSYGAAAGTQIGYEFNSGFYAGSNPDLTRYADPDERRLQLLDGLTWSIGKHTAKFGLEYNKVSDYENNLYNGNGSYSYDWTYSFIADYLNLTEGLGGPINTLPLSGQGPAPTCLGGGACYNQQYYSYSQEFGNPKGLIATREYAGYATDDWRITPNLSLTLGVRYEYEYVPPNPFVNTGSSALAAAAGVSLAQTMLPQTANRPDDRNNIGPRVGFSWNVYGDGKTILRGGYGMYYGRIVNVNILQTYIDSGSLNGQIAFSNLHPAQSTASGAKAGCGPVYPGVLPNTTASITSIFNCYQLNGGFNASTVAYFDPHFQNPQVHEADLAIEQSLGHNTTLGITYMMSLGRELPAAIDTNLALNAVTYAPYAVTPSTVSSTAPATYNISPNSEAATSLGGSSPYPQAPQTGFYVTLPHGGKTPPGLPPFYQGKFFIGGGTRTNTGYYQILDVTSSVNSSYNALALQLDKRYDHGLSLLTNITWSHALDENPYEGNVAPTESFLDPTNPRADYGNSATDVRLRYVGAIVYQPQTHFHGFLQQALGGWRIAPLVQAQTGLPYSATVSTSSLYNVYSGGTSYALTGSGVNGSGSGGANRVPWLHRDSFNYPKTAVFDMRLGKNFYLPTFLGLNARLELFAEVFNVMNHQNITGVTTEAYTLTDSSTNVPTFSPYAQFGQYTNSNSNYTYSPRQMQIAARLHF